MSPDVRSVLSRTPSIVRALFEGAAPNALEFHEKAGAWSPKQVLCHITDAEITDWMPRAKLILGEEQNKRFAPFDREGGFDRYAGWDAVAILNEFERLRHDNVSQLETFNITEADLQRTGLHPELGTVTLSQLLACWATHDLAHIEQISRSLVRHRAPTIGPWRQYYSLLAGY